MCSSFRLFVDGCQSSCILSLFMEGCFCMMLLTSDERVLKHIASKNVDYYVCMARRIQAVQGNINPNEERNETKRTDVFDETNLHIK